MTRQLVLTMKLRKPKTDTDNEFNKTRNDLAKDDAETPESDNKVLSNNVDGKRIFL